MDNGYTWKDDAILYNYNELDIETRITLLKIASKNKTINQEVESLRKLKELLSQSNLTISENVVERIMKFSASFEGLKTY